MKKKKWMVSALAVMLVVVLAGCGAKEEKAGKKAPEEW